MFSASLRHTQTKRTASLLARRAQHLSIPTSWRSLATVARTHPFPALAPFEHIDETPAIGTRFPKTTQLSNLLRLSNSDDVLRDLARLVSHRGVLFFHEQDISPEQQRELGKRLGELAGKPATSTLHIYPNDYSDTIKNKDTLPQDISTISSEGGVSRTGFSETARASDGWHSDTSFEPVPSDYAVGWSISIMDARADLLFALQILKLHTLPPTLVSILPLSRFAPQWASGYEAYDKLSPAYRKFLEGLTALHDAKGIREELAKCKDNAVYGPRGSPENIGATLQAIQFVLATSILFALMLQNSPVIRSHPVTGFKTLFINKFVSFVETIVSYTTRILELTEDESNDVLAYLTRHVSENHDLQVRFRWGKNDVAIWDNRCTMHTATIDYAGLRQGDRVVSVGERPYLDPDSGSRRESLEI
ncbi:taurine catabolism dioxygenase [Favolaschia claudopus]|uniref:Taurine catabolism dioxygenase n=1 Tax=Favolaschia claudopus TaxID=2862362 RepID=A0AAW0CTN6_9AGAR